MGGLQAGGAIGQTSSEMGYKLFGGYDFFRHFAVEAGYVDVGGASVETTFPIQSSATTEAKGFAVEAVGLLPLGQRERFNVFAKYGFYLWDATVTASIDGFGSMSASDDGTDPTYGLGVGWWVIERGQLRFELDRYAVDTMDVDTYLFGFAYSF